MDSLDLVQGASKNLGNLGKNGFGGFGTFPNFIPRELDCGFGGKGKVVDRLWRNNFYFMLGSPNSGRKVWGKLGQGFGRLEIGGWLPGFGEGKPFQKPLREPGFNQVLMGGETKAFNQIRGPEIRN